MITDEKLNIELPELDEEIALGEAEDFATQQSDLAAGKIDTAKFSEIPEGTYDVEITGCKVKSKKNREGTVVYPDLVWKLREVNGAFTTSVYWATSHGKPSARRFFGHRIVTTFSRLLGKAYNEVIPPKITPENALAAKVEFYNKLGAMVTGSKARLKVVMNEDGYNDATLNQAR